VNDGVALQYHGLPITSIFARNVTSRFLAITRLQRGVEIRSHYFAVFL